MTDDKLPPSVRQQAKAAVSGPSVEQTRQKWRAANKSGELRSVELQISKPDDQWWIATFQDASRDGLRVGNGVPTPEGWKIALNPPGGTIAVNNDGVAIPGTDAGVEDTSPFPQATRYETIRETAKEVTLDGKALKSPVKPVLSEGEIHEKVWRWPSAMASEANLGKSRVLELRGSDGGYTADCSGLTASGQITQMHVNQGSCRVKWGAETQGAYVVVNAQSEPQTLVIPAGRCEQFKVWQNQSNDAKAFTLCLEEACAPGMMKMRKNTFNMGNDSGSPMHVTAPVTVEVEGMTDQKLGKTYRRVIPLFEKEAEKDGRLKMRPGGEIEAEVKGAAAAMEKERQQDLLAFQRGGKAR